MEVHGNVRQFGGDGGRRFIAMSCGWEKLGGGRSMAMSWLGRWGQQEVQKKYHVVGELGAVAGTGDICNWEMGVGGPSQCEAVHVGRWYMSMSVVGK